MVVIGAKIKNRKNGEMCNILDIIVCNRFYYVKISNGMLCGKNRFNEEWEVVE